MLELLHRTGAAALSIAVLASCGGGSDPPDDALAVVRESVLSLHESDLRGPEVLDLTLGEANEILYGGEGRTSWCVAVHAVTSDPDHWLEGNNIWLAFEEDEGWRALPTMIIATGGTWSTKCEMPDFEFGPTD